MLKSKWATQEGEAPAATPAQQETAATEAPAVNVTYDAAYPDPAVDPFAQTAGTDDLFFDDDITPISQPVVEQSTLGATAPAFVPAPQSAPTPQTQPPKAPREPRAERGRGRGRGRGEPRARGEQRGRGRGGRARGGPVGDIRLEEAAAPTAPSAPAAAAVPTASPPADAPTGPATPSTASVRGDRTLTGGSKRTRLTEAELSLKLANMRRKNDALASAHARAEADAAAAAAREAVLKTQEAARKKAAAEKVKVERRERQVLMGERERNRLRKLNAQGGREWDLEKEEGFDGTGEVRRGAGRGAHGGVVREGRGDGARELFDGETGARGGRGRGRGGRGARGGRGEHHDARPDGRSHEGRSHESKSNAPPAQPKAADFPALPSSTPAAPSPNAPRIQEFKIKGKAEANKNEDIRKSEPALQAELGAPATTSNETGDTAKAKGTDKTTDAAEKKTDTAEKKDDAKGTEPPARPAIAKVESFGLEPMRKGQSWADDE